MKETIIDNSLLVLAALTAFLITRLTKARRTGAVGSFFLLLAPLVVFLNMWAHTVAVLAVNYQRYRAGNFRFGFPFYGLVFFGIVFIVTSGINIDLARKRISGSLVSVSLVHWLNLGTALLFLPMMFINPIALLPVLCSLVSSLTLRFTKPFKAKLIYDRNKTAVLQRERTGAPL